MLMANGSSFLARGKRMKFKDKAMHSTHLFPVSSPPSPVFSLRRVAQGRGF